VGGYYGNSGGIKILGGEKADTRVTDGEVGELKFTNVDVITLVELRVKSGRGRGENHAGEWVNGRGSCM